MTRIAALAIMAAAVAWGQAAEASVSMGASIFTDKNLGQISLTEPLKLGNGFRATARLSLNTWRFLGHEFGYGYDRSSLDFGASGKTGMAVHQGFYNFLVHALPEGSSIRPFICGGGGFSTFYPPGTSAFSGNGFTEFGYNYGAGVKLRVTELYGLRFDVRDYVTGKPFDLPETRGLLHNIEVSAGFAIFF